MLKKLYSDLVREAGTDEAGRGCLAGPVTCAAILLDFSNKIHNPTNTLFDKINDSKKLSEKTRLALKPTIEQQAKSFRVMHISPKTIDEINILQASILGMQQATLALDIKPQHLIVDGNRFNSGIFLPADHQKIFYKNGEPSLFENQIPYTTIVKGDSKYLSIAAASILAKTYRDDYMLQIHEEFPMYNWAKNKGYPTVEHQNAIKKYGRCKYHRMSFLFKYEKTK